VDVETKRGGGGGVRKGPVESVNVSAKKRQCRGRLIKDNKKKSKPMERRSSIEFKSPNGKIGGISRNAHGIRKKGEEKPGGQRGESRVGM